MRPHGVRVVVVLLLAPVFDRVRPTVPAQLVPALDFYLALLESLLLRGTVDPGADVQRLNRELDDPEMLVCVQYNVVGWEFGRIVKTVADDGPGELSVGLATMWPPMLAAEAATVTELANAVKQAVGKILQMDSAAWLRRDLADAWGLPDEPDERRKRGRPRDRAGEGVLTMGARDGMFDAGARPHADVAVTIAARSDGRMTRESAYRRLKSARAAAPIPEGWEQTLWHERVQPLHVDHFTEPRHVVGTLRKFPND